MPRRPMRQFTADPSDCAAHGISRQFDIPVNTYRGPPIRQPPTYRQPESVQAVQPVALNDRSPNRVERIPDGEQCQKASTIGALSALDGGPIQKPMVQVDHIVFWDWMLK